MHKNKPAEAELIPSPDMILRAGVDKATLDRIVQQRVAEIMAERDAVVFEPFFRSRQIAYELKRLQTMPEQRKWTVFFDRYGCLICETRKRIHVGNGMCTQCYARTFRTLKQIIAEGISGDAARPSSRALLQAQPAQIPRLLSEHAPGSGHTDAGISDARGKAHKGLLSNRGTL
jgi:hypothetical protein